MSSTAPTVPRWVAGVSEVLSLLGLAGLMLTVALGFETPNTAMLVVSSTLVFAMPLAAFWHFMATRTLTPEEKRIWRRELTGAEAFAALSEYMRSPDLRASAAAAAARKQI